MEEYFFQIATILQKGYLSVLLLKIIIEVIRLGALYKLFPKLKLRKSAALVLYLCDCKLYEAIWRKKYGVVYFVFNWLAILAYCSIPYLSFFANSLLIVQVMLYFSLICLIIASIINTVAMIKLVNIFRCPMFVKLLVVAFNPLALYLLSNKNLNI